MIDLNADLGEGVGDDDALLAVVTSANVACGFHAGDAETMRRVCAVAVARGVGVGAHVSYRDREGFGRRQLDVEAERLRADVEEQLGALAAIAREAGTAVAHVKPHGGLYNRAARDAEQAAAVVDAVAPAGLPMFGLPGSALLEAAAAAGLDAVPEAFADRAYEPDGSLRSRDEDGAVLEDEDAVVARAVAFARDGRVRAHDGSVVEVRARTLCLHGDTPGAVALARAVRAALEAAGVGVTRVGR